MTATDHWTKEDRAYRKAIFFLAMEIEPLQTKLDLVRMRVTELVSDIFDVPLSVIVDAVIHERLQSGLSYRVMTAREEDEYAIHLRSHLQDQNEARGLAITAPKAGDPLKEHLQNCLGAIDTPVGRRKLGLAADTDWLVEARRAAT